MKRIVPGLVLLTVLSACQGNGQSAQPSAIIQRDGPALYTAYCQSCHGAQGKGDGKLAYLLYPKPRDFTAGKFKIRSTATGQAPASADLEVTITRGMPGTAMPPFGFLKPEEIKRLADHVKTLANLAKPGAPEPAVLQVPPAPPATPALLAEGKKLFTEVGCIVCHGDSGRGNGEGAKELVDEWNYPITPRDFTQGVFLGGGKPENLYLRILTGLNGTPMLGFEETLKAMAGSDAKLAEMTWSLVYYVKSFDQSRLEENPALPPGATFAATSVDDGKSQDDFLNTASAEWRDAPVARVPLSRLWKKDDNNHEHAVIKALRNARYVAVMMSWDDATREADSTKVQDFQDGAAVQFSLAKEPGFTGMGSHDEPVNIWHWKSEWQARHDADNASDIASAYGGRASDGNVETYPETINELSHLPGVNAGNPLSRSKILSPVENAVAAGPQTLTSQAREDKAEISGKGTWDGKNWTVVFVRELGTGEAGDVQFTSGGEFPVAFAVWNGRMRDRDGQKLVSGWYKLKL